MYSSKSLRPVWAEVHLGAIRHNYKKIRAHLKEDDRICGVVKADAYGHGSIEVARELIKIGAEYLAVATVDEAIELRGNGINSPILILGPADPNAFGKFVEFNLFPTVTSFEYAKALAEIFRYRGIFPRVHILVDSGMGRLGIPIESALIEIEKISKLEGLIIDGIFSHYPVSDTDIEFSTEQTNRFANLISDLHQTGIRPKHIHIANSDGIFNIDSATQTPFNMVRPGLSLYGYSVCDNQELINSMVLKARVADIRLMKKGETVSYGRTYQIKKEKEYIAVLPLGYADGIPTLYSNRGKVLIGDVYYPVTGRVCMDYMMVSLEENRFGVKPGDVSTLFGEGKIRVETFAKACHRIPYEVTCGISKRVPRIYIRKEKDGKNAE